MSRPTRKVAPAVFVDRDGVICEDRDQYIRAWVDFDFIPGSIEALASLSRANHRLFVVTNQSPVGRGLITRSTLDGIHRRMVENLEGAGARIEAVFVCPHHPDDGCACRKPKPGLLVEAARTHKIDLSRSFMIGDRSSDIAAGEAAGCETVLVRTGPESPSMTGKGSHPTFVADDLVDAAIWILGRNAMRSFPAGVER